MAKGDIVCVHSNMDVPGYDLVRMAGVPPHAFPVLALQTGGNEINLGTFEIYDHERDKWIGWGFPNNATDYVYLLEEA